MSRGDKAAASVFVAVRIEDAFAVFTEELDAWWRHGRAFRNAGNRPGQMHLESSLGGRLFETFETASGEQCLVVGKVLAWDPPLSFALEWRNVNFKPDEKTLVEVTFKTQGRGTMVRVEHSGFASLRKGHPARHGLVGSEFSRMMGMWWGQQLSSFRELLADPG